MKNPRVDAAIRAIIKLNAKPDELSKGKIEEELEDLSPEEKRRVLMHVANYAISGHEMLTLEVIELLEVRNQEVLVFANAALGCRAPTLVPKLVKRFCKETEIARKELARAAFKAIDVALDVSVGPHVRMVWLRIAVECVLLMQTSVGPQFKGLKWNNEATNLVLFIVYALDTLVASYPQKFIRHCRVQQDVKRGLKELVRTKKDKIWFGENKCRPDLNASRLDPYRECEP
jgi:hypothetical protein